MAINPRSILQRLGVFLSVFALALFTQIAKDGALPKNRLDWALDCVAALIACCPIGQDPTGLKALRNAALQGLLDWLRAPADKRAQIARDREADLLSRAEAAGEKALTQHMVRLPDGTLITLAEALAKGLVIAAPTPDAPRADAAKEDAPKAPADAAPDAILPNNLTAAGNAEEVADLSR